MCLCRVTGDAREVNAGFLLFVVNADAVGGVFVLPFGLQHSPTAGENFACEFVFPVPQ